MLTHLMRPLNADTYPHDAAEYAPEMLKAWLEEFPESQPTQRDKEDWVENAVFLQVFKELELEYENPEQSGQGFVSASVDTISSNGTKPAFFHTGISRMDQAQAVNYDLFAQKSDMVAGNMLYGRSATFQDRCGRKVAFAPPDNASINEAVSTVAPNGGRVFVKTIKKESTNLFDIDMAGGVSPIDQINEQDDGFIWGHMHLEGSTAPYYLVQEAISPKYEYRVFMVGDEPVTGAGCVEAYTPLDNEMLFDSKMEATRNQDAVKNYPEIAKRYEAFAREFGKAYASEVGIMNAYSLDLCINDDTGEIAIIELNPAMNLGRYASSVTAWVKAIDALGAKNK